MYLLAFIVPILAILLESYPRLLNRKFGVDIWTHLLYLKEYHRQKGIPKVIDKGFLVKGSYDYPPAFITILSKFPIKVVEKYEFLFSPIFDAIHLLLIFLIVYILTQSIYISLFTQILYLFTPIIVIENSSATPRSLGYTLFTSVFILLFLFSNGGSLFLFFVAVVIGSLIFLSHRFSTQGYLFFSIIFSIIYLNYFFILAFLISFILATILSRGFYLQVLRGHLGNLHFWIKVIHTRFYHQVKGAPRGQKTNDFVFSVYNKFLKFPPFVLAITNPWVIPVIYIFYIGNNSDEYITYFTIWIVISYVIALFTIWIPKLRFLGEGQRYLELSAFPSAFIASYVLFSLFGTKYESIVIVLYTATLILSLVTIFVIQRKAIVKDTLRTLTPNLVNMYSFMNKEKVKYRLLCVPHQITTNTIYHTNSSVFVNADYKSIDKIIDVYPYIKMPIDKIMKKHSLDAILLNEDYATITDLRLVNFKIIKRFENIVLIKLI